MTKVMRNSTKKLALLLVLLIVISCFGTSAFAADNDSIDTKVVTRAIDSVNYTANVYVYKPANPHYAGTYMPTVYVYPGAPVADEQEAYDLLNASGIKGLADEAHCFVAVVNPIDAGGYTDKDVQMLLSIKDLFSDAGYIQGGITAAGLYGGNRSRCYMFGEGAGADFITEYLSKRISYSLTFGDGVTIPFNFMPTAVALFNTSAESPSGDDPMPVYLVNGGEGVADSYKTNNGTKAKTIVKTSSISDGFDPALVSAAWNDLLYGLMRIEVSTGHFVLYERPNYDALGVTVTEYLKSNVVDSRARTFFTYEPATINDGDPVPLFLLFHGGGNSAQYFAEASGFIQLAAKENFMVVSVQHSGVTGGSADTAATVVQLLDWLIANYNIDANKVYASGFSMGSIMSMNLAQNFSTRFAGIAPFDAVTTINVGSSFVPTFYGAGEDDPLVAFPKQGSNAFACISNILTRNGYVVDPSLTYANRATWPNSYWAFTPDKQEVVTADTGNEYTLNYYKSAADGIAYTVLANISKQSHDTVPYSSTLAWNFLKQFSRNDDGSLSVDRIELSGDAGVVAGEKANYTVSTKNIANLATITVWLEVEDAYFSGDLFEGLNGFQLIGNVEWTRDGDKWVGRATFGNMSGGVDSMEKLDIIKIMLNTKGTIGTTSVKLVKAVLSGYDESGAAVFIDAIVGNDTVNTAVTDYFSPYDVNRDGKVDQLDLTMAQLYYTAEVGDDNWDAAKLADVNDDGIVDIQDFILILNNIVW